MTDDLDFSIEGMTPLPRVGECTFGDDHRWVTDDRGRRRCTQCGALVANFANPPEPGSLIAELYRTHQPPASRALFGSFAPSAPTVPHASYLGASDIGAILGLDPFKTPLDVWARKTGRVPEGPSSEEIEAGNDHEAGVIAGAVRKLRRRGVLASCMYPGPGTIRGGTWTLDGDPWRAATLDAAIVLVDGTQAALEAKLVGAGRAHEWGPEPAGAAGVPERVLAQVHWQTMHLRERWTSMPARVAYVAADICGTDRRLYEVVIDDDLVCELLEAGRAWWERHVLHDEMPVPTARDIATLGRVFPTVERPLSPFVPFEVRQLAEDYSIGREITLRHHVETQKIGALLRAALGDAEGYRWHGGKVTWRETADGSRRLYVKVRRTDE